MTAQKWIRSSLRQLSRQLQQLGQRISAPTLARLLRQLNYSLRRNLKQQESNAQHPARDQQFAYIAQLRQAFHLADQPAISADTKKKELIGNFKNEGVAWVTEPEEVNSHDFPQQAVGQAVPYGIYDLATQQGLVWVGQSADTAEFAVKAIANWWEAQGWLSYPKATKLLILVDGGGSNGYRLRLWKQQLQVALANRFGLEVVVAHYPPGCSKWNPIEHKLFSQISRNWAGKPLRSFEVMLNYLRGTQTSKGLRVEARLLPGVFLTGKVVTKGEFAALNIEYAPICPQWNYTIRPQPFSTPLFPRSGT